MIRISAPLAAATLLSACATHQPQIIKPASAPAPVPPPMTLEQERIPPTAMPTAVESPAPAGGRMETLGEVSQAIQAGNGQAVVLPQLSCFVGAACRHWYTEGGQYVVPMIIHDLSLVCMKRGEIVGDVVAPGKQMLLPHDRYSFGRGDRERQCIGFTPNRAGVNVNVAIMTDKRLYNLEIHVYPETKRYGVTGGGKNPGMSPVETFHKANVTMVEWRYPEDEASRVLNSGAAPREARLDRKTGIELAKARCNYELSGESAYEWMPVKMPDTKAAVCDDGEKTYINFAPGALSGMGTPTLVRIAKDGQTRMPVQYERLNSSYVVAGVFQHLLLFQAAEEVHITREEEKKG
jgi:type IV secretory pathway VirB9-like protein